MKFKVGDKVKIIRTTTNDSKPFFGETVIIEGFREFESSYDKIYYTFNDGLAVWEKDLILVKSVNNNNKIMNILETIKLTRKSEPEKTLVKAGLMNMDESLTSEGKEVLNDLILQDYKDKMKAQADIILAEQKVENK